MTRRPTALDSVVPARPDGGGGAATPSFRLPDGSADGQPGPARRSGSARRCSPGVARTWVMGILNVTPDSFSGDGLLAGTAAGDPVASAVAPRPADG